MMSIMFGRTERRCASLSYAVDWLSACTTHDPIDAAIRAGRRFAVALSAIPAGEGAKFGEIKSLVEQSLSLLDAQGGASKPRRTDMQPGS
jgi:hypothetical protein